MVDTTSSVSELERSGRRLSVVTASLSGLWELLVTYVVSHRFERQLELSSLNRVEHYFLRGNHPSLSGSVSPVMRNPLRRKSACMVAICVYGGGRGVPVVITLVSLLLTIFHSGFIPLCGHFPSDIRLSGILKEAGKT